MKLPPYAELLGMTLEPGEGAPVVLMPFAAGVIGRPGFLHGGALAGLLEMAAIVALDHMLEGEGRGGCPIKPIAVTVDFMRGGREKTTRAQGRVIRLGRRVANVEALAWQDDRGAIAAAARMNFLLE